jgi:hypothetical protein
MPARELEMVERYLADIRTAAKGAPALELNEFIEEIRSHIVDRLASTNDVETVLRAMGDPRQLAAQFTSQVGLRREARSFSPWSLLRGMLRWSVAGTAGLLSFVLSLFGYGCAFVFFASLLLKPLFPDRIGVWLGPESTVTYGFWDGHIVNSSVYGISVRPAFQLSLGTLSPTDGPVRELAGQHIYTIGVLGGCLALFATTLFSRWVMQRFGRRRWFPASSPKPLPAEPVNGFRAAGSGLPR